MCFYIHCGFVCLGQVYNCISAVDLIVALFKFARFMNCFTVFQIYSHPIGKRFNVSRLLVLPCFRQEFSQYRQKQRLFQYPCIVLRNEFQDSAEIISGNRRVIFVKMIVWKLKLFSCCIFIYRLVRFIEVTMFVSYFRFSTKLTKSE